FQITTDGNQLTIYHATNQTEQSNKGFTITCFRSKTSAVFKPSYANPLFIVFVEAIDVVYDNIIPLRSLFLADVWARFSNRVWLLARPWSCLAGPNKRPASSSWRLASASTVNRAFSAELLRRQILGRCPRQLKTERLWC